MHFSAVLQLIQQGTQINGEAEATIVTELAYKQHLSLKRKRGERLTQQQRSGFYRAQLCH